MSQVISGFRRRVEGVPGTAEERLRAARARWRWFDHLARAYERYQDRRGNRLAAALTCYGFLSFFPLLALAYSLLGYLVGVSEPARDYFVDAIDSLLPGLSDQLQLQEIVESKTAVGLFGLAALLFTGLVAVQVLRESLRIIWGLEPDDGGNFFLKKVWDGALLIFLGGALILAMAVSAVTTQATHMVLGLLGLEDVTGAGTVLRLLSLAVAITFNTLIFLMLFTRLSGTRAPWRRILRGALFGALGFELLKQIATLLLGHTTSNPVYASFAVLVGLMVWINLVSRFLLLVAAWTATRSLVLHADGTQGETGGAEAKTEAGGGVAPDSQPV